MSSSEHPLSGWTARNRGFASICAVTVVALVLRLFALGDRFAHWDEARVGYWILRYQKTGIWHYHADIHGPFFPQVNSVLFELFGASDFMARLPVALVTGLLPLAAWLYRDHLRDSELVAFALLLAVNPVALYYSRVMRYDMLLAAFMVFALGFYLRAQATGKARYLYAGTLALALGFTTKENALLYVASWLGAAVLLFDHRLFLARNYDREWTGTFVDTVTETGRGLLRFAPHIALCVVEFFVVIVYFYAPRTNGTSGPGLWKAVSNPSMFGAVISEATVGSWNEFTGQWVKSQGHAYLPYLEHFIAVLEQGAFVVVVLAVLGFLAARYVDDRPRDLVSFAFYWGAVSVLGYPLVTDIQAGWVTVHAIVPLMIPAAVGASIIYHWGREAYEDDDTFSTAAAGVIALFLVVQVAFPAITVVYLHPQDANAPGLFGGQHHNDIVQWGQPADGIKPTMEKVQRVSQANREGTDVLYYGYLNEDSSYVFYVPNEDGNTDYRNNGGWYNRLPLPWYTEMVDANVDSTLDNESLQTRQPPVVITRASRKEDVEKYLDGYRVYDHELTLWGAPTTIYIKESALREANRAA
ncbi:dolichyl-phosphate-mannose-proteinmannosyltransfe rase [Haladaptatus paucihalophilus DX253]|uniref:Dolichyl-phosphate-mannose-proteinmannosyltransfe rase n=1 Tax=Haladaptatus paucihalophilus DX253 TaxID=797209 RepID=E7QRE5_HALPU|nr:flippase activity-associated protein Agl23 [Haladaptatus paucihalophilus]EFW92564.1 dolichyl-phosphate-mannose-proteinmannosyltransfe rase [Haladaptatus paucihalophilus DX253]SHK19110.1 TIGR03663 family protein [Haladaptatus paucihalophilus DX253]